MTTITFLNNSDLSTLYNHDTWKEYVSSNFDENVLVIGNREYSSIEEAPWWKRATELISDLDDSDWTIDEFIYYEDTCYTKEQLEKVYKAYQNCRYSDDTEFIVEVAQIINPGLELEQVTARGYSQSDWVEIVFVKDTIKVEIFETYFFGQLTEVHIESDDDDYWDYMPDSEVYDLFHNNDNVEKALRDRYDIKDDEPINIVKK